MGEVYHLNSPTIGILSIKGHGIPTMVPRGALIKVVGGPLEGTGLVDCLWENTELKLFSEDIRERGALVQGA